MPRLRSAIRFVDSSSGESVDALKNARMSLSSADLGWPGLLVEKGENRDWNVQGVAVRDHYVALNTDVRALHVSVKRNETFHEVVMPPGSLWFCPAEESFTHQVRQPCRFIVATLRPERLARLVGDDGVKWQRGYGVSNPQLEYVLRALDAEVNDGGVHGPTFADALATALAARLVETFATVPQHRAGPRLAPQVLHRVREKIESDLGSALTVMDLANAADLSPAHFSRAFKASFGLSPYQYILERRLSEARTALECPGARVLEVALRFGFADQAHLTRTFRLHFGATPGELVQTQRARTRHR
ncbi:AraC family transcriptional regulator [Pendulispora rubella]|uniref:AraC family transcriptional regulator n=1 Tax=Pendulispora rubella TaxID=2741070 RepID=A0ABZ2LDI3_9BACT